MGYIHHIPIRTNTSLKMMSEQKTIFLFLDFDIFIILCSSTLYLKLYDIIEQNENNHVALEGKLT